MIQTERIKLLTTQLYGSEQGADITRRIHGLVADYRGRLPRHHTHDLSEKDSILIAYPDQVTTPGQSPLSVLADFAERHLRGLITGIHLLPFYPWSSDDGFSVMDFRAVAARYGTWNAVRRLGRQFDLMLDAEINHASAKSDWFHLFQEGQAPYRDYFIRIDGTPDLSGVSRPRTTPLVTHFQSDSRDTAVWTTFGSDQVDLNYRSPALLVEMLDVLLFYASQGATFVRLDAVAYLWKQVGTTCINLPQTHLLVQLIRAVLDEVAPYVKLITETNVPQADNLAYFGDGTNEAQLIYNFPLPPLVLHAFQTSQAGTLGRWMSQLQPPTKQVTFLNVLATHDGIGLNPLHGILPEGEIQGMVEQCIGHGGLMSSKMNPDGKSSPYELNMNYFDALDALGPEIDPGLKAERLITAHAIMLSLRGVPALYFHSLFGSRGWPQGVVSTGRKRSINREKLRRDRLEAELADRGSVRAQVFRKLSRLLAVRSRYAAFSPNSAQRVAASKGPVLALIRGTKGAVPQVLCLYNVSAERCEFRVDDPDLAAGLTASPRELITDATIAGGAAASFGLEPYQSMWLALDN